MDSSTSGFHSESVFWLSPRRPYPTASPGKLAPKFLSPNSTWYTTARSWKVLWHTLPPGSSALIGGVIIRSSWEESNTPGAGRERRSYFTAADIRSLVDEP